MRRSCGVRIDGRGGKKTCDKPMNNNSTVWSHRKRACKPCVYDSTHPYPSHRHQRMLRQLRAETARSVGCMSQKENLSWCVRDSSSHVCSKVSRFCASRGHGVRKWVGLCGEKHGGQRVPAVWLPCDCVLPRNHVNIRKDSSHNLRIL
jgi:hypothetical protein